MNCSGTDGLLCMLKVEKAFDVAAFQPKIPSTVSTVLLLGQVTKAF